MVSSSLATSSVRPSGGFRAATRRPWYRLVRRPDTVLEANPPMPLVHSHARNSASGSRPQISRPQSRNMSPSPQGVNRPSHDSRPAGRLESWEARTLSFDEEDDAGGVIQHRRREGDTLVTPHEPAVGRRHDPPAREAVRWWVG